MKIKQVFFFIILIASFFIINNMVHSIYDLWQKKHLVVDAREEIDKEKKEQTDLKQKLELVNKTEFIEQEARNKLFMSKPGDGVVVVSEKDLKGTMEKKKIADTRPNWKKWQDLFF